MNFLALIVGLFGRGVASQVKEATERGKADGEAIADAYCDGLFTAAGDRFQKRLRDFHGDAPVVVLDPPKRIVRKPARK